MSGKYAAGVSVAVKRSGGAVLAFALAVLTEATEAIEVIEVIEAVEGKHMASHELPCGVNNNSARPKANAARYRTKKRVRIFPPVCRAPHQAFLYCLAWFAALDLAGFEHERSRLIAFKPCQIVVGTLLAAVYAEYLTSNPTGIVRGEEQNGMGDVLRRAEAFEGDALHQLVLACLAVALPLALRCRVAADEARGDVVDRDPPKARFIGRCFVALRLISGSFAPQRAKFSTTESE
jgi:hypothetical protein